MEWYKYYFDRFEAGTARMKDNEVGCYWRLLNVQFKRGAVPLEIDQIQLAVTSNLKVISKVLLKFQKTPAGYVNPLMDEVRTEWAEYQQRQSAKGKLRHSRTPAAAEPDPSHREKTREDQTREDQTIPSGKVKKVSAKKETVQAELIPNDQPDPTTFTTWTILDFRKVLAKYVQQYEADLLKAFFEHWTAPSKVRGKLLFQIQPGWFMGGRLATWKKNDDEKKARYSPSQKIEKNEPLSRRPEETNWTGTDFE